jgi:ribosome-associated protein YbcJ (S4-like RNA binding protein)
LLVGETPGFAERGGAVNFFIEENKVRFEINPEVAKRRHLKISSKLLGLAKIAQGQEQ